MFLRVNKIDSSFLQLLFFLAKKVANPESFGQDGQPHNLAIKTPVLIPYPHTRPGPASRSFGIIPPRLEQTRFSFN